MLSRNNFLISIMWIGVVGLIVFLFFTGGFYDIAFQKGEIINYLKEDYSEDTLKEIKLSLQDGVGIANIASSEQDKKEIIYHFTFDERKIETVTKTVRYITEEKIVLKGGN